MKRMLFVAAIALLSGCNRVDDHPEAFIKVHTGTYEHISIVQFDGYLTVIGAWTLEGADKIAAPVNVSTIRCVASDGACRINRSEIMNMAGSTWLMDREDTYKIRVWDSQQLVAINQDGCRRNELRIDITANVVSEITDNRPGGDCSASIVGPVTAPRVARLISSAELEALKKQGKL